MSAMLFNAVKPTITRLSGVPEINEWPKEDWKYADVKHVHDRTTDLVRRVIAAAPLTYRFKRILIDVKVQNLTPEICSCIPGWHIDGAFPSENKPDDIHHLFVANGPLTEFINEPVMLNVDRTLLPDMQHVLRQIPQDVKITTCAANAITTFTSRDFHRGVHAKTPTRRLLVRLTETNTILPRNKPQPPSQGAIIR